MKLLIPKAGEWEQPDGSPTLQPEIISFSRDGKGSWKALVPVKLPNSGSESDTRSFITQVPVVLSDDFTSTNKNRKRIMLKVAMPYTAISPDVANDSVVANQFDSRRSGGELSSHVVLSVPAACSSDFQGDSGSTCQRGAVAQIRLSLKVLAMMLDGLANNLAGAVVITPGEDGAPSTYYMTEHRPLQDCMDMEGKNARYDSTTDVVDDKLVALHHNGLVGFDCSSMGDLRRMTTPLFRGVAGIQPLDDEAELAPVAEKR